ncbi:hypothetical protein Rhow_006724 [Rhodococcus wratislaviensis]|uniref:Uncharacterized protein n=1 Tax=Rhodococcus wratislaviensis TaxID=44752 RepID=A0A402CG82_RHOWR|nr:hypothetical protein Rhow_006724 [Rhodococcus wratislaviensis]
MVLRNSGAPVWRDFQNTAAAGSNDAATVARLEAWIGRSPWFAP